MAACEYDKAHKMLPRSFREVYTQPKIREQVKAIGEVKVNAMIQFELGVLASLMVTGGNLNGTMTEFIAAQLMELYPTESIADIKVCLERGAMGRYGEIQRIDSVTIGLWMEGYLDEKYSELEKEVGRKQAELRGDQKAPVEGLENVYANMVDESKKKYDRSFIAEDEFLRKKQKYGPAESVKQSFTACEPVKCAARILVETSVGWVCNACGKLAVPLSETKTNTLK